MFLENIYNHYRSQSPKGSIALTKFDLYVIMLNNRKLKKQNRYIAKEYTNTKGIRLLKQIITKLDFEHTNKFLSDSDLLFDYILPMTTILEGEFDPIITGKQYSNIFFSDRGLWCPDEIIIPMRDEKFLSNLPLDEPWVMWQNLKPVKLLSSDLTEYTLDMTTGYIRFNELPPLYTVIGIDVVILTMMFLKYKKEHPDEPYPVETFCHKYILYYLLDDVQDIWLMNLLSSMAKNITKKEISINELKSKMVPDGMNYLGAQFKTIYKEFLKEFNKVKSGSTNIYKIMDTIYLTNVDTSLLDLLNDHMTTYHSEREIQRAGINHMKERNLVELITNLALLNKNSSDSSNLTKRLNRAGRQAIRQKIWSKGLGFDKDIIKEDVQYYKTLR